MDRHEEEYRKLALSISFYRKRKGLTQVQLAEKLGISRQHLNDIEAPDYPISFSVMLLFRIANALEVEPEALLDFE